MAGRTFPWLGLAAACLVVWLAVHYLLPVLIPFALAFTLAYVLNPLANAAEVRGLRREAVVVTGYLVVLGSIVLLAGWLLPALGRQLASLQSGLPGYVARLKVSWADFQAQAVAQMPFLADHIRQLDAGKALGRAAEMAQHLPTYLLSFFPLLSTLILIPFISFFLLMDGSASVERMIQRCPSRYVEQVLHLISEIDYALGAYLRGLVLVATALGLTSYVGLWILGVDQAFWIAVLSGVSSFVPYFGAIIGMIVGGLMAAIQFGSAVAGFKVVALFLALRLADEIFLQPYIAKHSVHLHPLVFLFAFMTGGELFGFIGLVFAIPVTCIIKALIDVGWSWYSTEARLRVCDEVDTAVVPFT